MKLNIRFILLFIASAAFVFAGCRRVDNVVWSRYTSIPSEGWDPVNVIPFFPWPEDSINNPNDRYSLILSARFSSRNKVSTLHLVVHQEDEGGDIKSDTLSLRLAPPADSPVGKGAYAVYETVDTLERGIAIRPGYCVELQSLSAPENSRGIMDIGLILALDNYENNKTPLIKK